VDGRADLELLRIEIDTLWRNPAGGLRNPPHVVIACASDAVGAEFIAEVGPDLEHAVRTVIQSGEVPHEDPGRPPPIVDRCRTLLQEALVSPVQVRAASGPTYLVHDTVAWSGSTSVVRSDGREASRVRGANPGNWSPGEWQDLVAGRRGAWAMAMHAEQVISICHTSVRGPLAAEAGVWTHPAFRGQGHAAAVTAAWASLMRATGGVLFYSTSRANRSSQQVAARLHLRPVGWLWQLARDGRAEVNG
jgi:hypothetical protein